MHAIWAQVEVLVDNIYKPPEIHVPQILMSLPETI